MSNPESLTSPFPPPPPPPPPQAIENTADDQIVITDAVPLSQVPPSKTKHYARFFHGPHFGLPDGWVIEQRPRNSLKYFGKVDQFFYEPATHKQFRSVKSVEKHFGREFPALRAQIPLEGGADAMPTYIMTRKRKKRRTFDFDFAEVPESITWALTDADKDVWTPFVGETRLPGELKDHWTETFMKITKGKNTASHS